MDKTKKDIVIISKDIAILKSFFEIYCHKNHSNQTIIYPSGIIKNYFSQSLSLCDNCRKQFLYAAVKRIICPYNPKPDCKKCPSICYSDEHRRFMKEMMRYSGKYMIMHGRIDLIFKYLF